MPSHPSILVIGSYNFDLTFRCPSFPSPGQTIVGELRTGPGGKGANQAVAASRTGVPTCFVGAVGCDSFAAEARNFLSKQGIQLHLAEKTNAPTGTASIILDTTGQNQIVVDPGANLQLHPQDLPTGLLDSAAVILCQLEVDLETVRKALQTARTRGIPGILNTAPFPASIDPSILSLASILMPNETEFVTLVTRHHPHPPAHFSEAALHELSTSALATLCKGFGWDCDWVITLGSRGAFIFPRNNAPYTIPAHSGLTVVDTVGAGDAFAGGFAAGLLKYGFDIGKAARFANAVAALSVTKAGAAPAMPYAEDIHAFLSRPEVPANLRP